MFWQDKWFVLPLCLVFMPCWVISVSAYRVAVSVNFFFMAVGTSLAADKAEQQDVKGGKTLLQISMLLRYGVLFAALFAFAKSGLCNAVSMVLPLIFVRPILSFGEFFRKKGDEKP